MTNEQILQIKEWLRCGRKDHLCPFHYSPTAGLICMKLFPKIINKERVFILRRICGIFYECPCNVYGVAGVVARAEEVVNGHR